MAHGQGSVTETIYPGKAIGHATKVRIGLASKLPAGTYISGRPIRTRAGCLLALAGREVPPAVLTVRWSRSWTAEIPIPGMKQLRGSWRLSGMHAPIQPIKPVADAALRALAMVLIAVVLIFVLFPAVLAVQAAAR